MNPDKPDNNICKDHSNSPSDETSDSKLTPNSSSSDDKGNHKNTEITQRLENLTFKSTLTNSKSDSKIKLSNKLPLNLSSSSSSTSPSSSTTLSHPYTSQSPVKVFVTTDGQNSDISFQTTEKLSGK